MAKKVVIENGKNKNYAVIYDERLDPQTGLQHLKEKHFRTSREADDFLEKLGGQKGVQIQMTMEQKENESTKVPFNEYAKDWFYNEYVLVVTNQTFKVRQVLLEKHIVPYFGDKYIHEITGKEMNEYFAQKRREGYSLSTISSIQNFLFTLFRSAVKKGYLDKHPMRFIKKINVSNRSPMILSDSEISKLLEVAHQEGEGLMYEFELCTGLRIAELLALSWSDIDFDKKMVIVNKYGGFVENGKPNIEGIRSGYRRVMMPSSLLPKLQKHKDEQQVMKKVLGDQYNKLDLVFPNKVGGIQRVATFRARFNRLVDKANIRRITFHDLRKTHISLLVRAEVPLYLISEQLGYRNMETVMHLLPPQFYASKKIPELFGIDNNNSDLNNL